MNITNLQLWQDLVRQWLRDLGRPFEEDKDDDQIHYCMDSGHMIYVGVYNYLYPGGIIDVYDFHVADWLDLDIPLPDLVDPNIDPQNLLDTIERHLHD